MKKLVLALALSLSYQAVAETCHENVNMQIANSSNAGLVEEDEGRFLSADRALDFITNSNTLDPENDGEYIHELMSLVTGEDFESYLYVNDAGGWLAISSRSNECRLVELIQIEEI